MRIKGRDHRRAAFARLGAAQRPCPRPAKWEARATPKLEKLAAAARPTDQEIADELGITVDELNDSLLAILALLDRRPGTSLWSVSDSKRRPGIADGTRSRTRGAPEPGRRALRRWAI